MINSNFNQSKKSQKISLQQNSFTPCKHQISLLEPLTDAAENAARRATILLSPALSSLDGFQNARDSGEKLYRTAESISWGHSSLSPNMNG
jgi:UDP-N-acetylmuramoylalanine-D-glutamate ligase